MHRTMERSGRDLRARLQGWRRSLIVRLGAALALVALLGTVSAVGLMQFVDASAGKAGAINVAGSLRMQSYAIGLALLAPDGDAATRRARVDASIAGFEARLRSPRLVDELPDDPGDPMRKAYDRLATLWHALRGVLHELPGPDGEDARHAAAVGTVPAIHGFVAEADHLVLMIQGDLENRIERYKMLGSFTLLLALAVLASTVWYAHRNLMTPLMAFQRAARAVRAGDFSARVGAVPVTEFDEPAAAFDRMTEDLSGMYGALEARVRAKTAELERSNRSLSLLYDVTRRLAQPGNTRERLTDVLASLERVLGVESAMICTGQDAPVPAVRLAELRAHRLPPGCVAADCGRCAAPGGQTVAIPLQDGDERHGTMTLRLAPGASLEAWQRELADAVGRHVAAALSSANRAQQQHRIVLMEERSAIARDLHDSLAQSLSYQKIQVARLRSALARPEASAEALRAALADPVDELRTGLDSAYRQLRELLTTFRLKVDGRGLSAMLRDTADEFSRRGGLDVRLDNRLPDLELGANQQIHVLQTVREALANVERHAHAAHAWVTLAQDGDGRVTVTVDDDGVGIGTATSPLHHHGLTIMRDRAASLGGRCEIGDRPGGGTRVALQFDAREGARP